MKNRCAYLDGDRRQCKNGGTYSYNYSGGEIYYRFDLEEKKKIAEWVKVFFCKKHRIKD